MIKDKFSNYNHPRHEFIFAGKVNPYVGCGVAEWQDSFESARLKRRKSLFAVRAKKNVTKQIKALLFSCLVKCNE